MINSYKDLTIGKYQEIRNIQATEELDVQVALLSILSDMDEDAILDLPVPQYKKMVQESTFLLKEPVVSPKCPKKVRMNGHDYYVMSDVRKMKTSQYIDYQTYLSKNDPDNYLPYILSCFIIPEGKTYNDGYDVSMVIDEIVNFLPIEIALSIARFFFIKLQSSIKTMLTYLESKMRKMMRKEKDKTVREKMMMAKEQMSMLRTLIRDGDGFRV